MILLILLIVSVKACENTMITYIQDKESEEELIAKYLGKEIGREAAIEYFVQTRQFRSMVMDSDRYFEIEDSIEQEKLIGLSPPAWWTME